MGRLPALTLAVLTAATVFWQPSEAAQNTAHLIDGRHVPLPDHWQPLPRVLGLLPNGNVDAVSFGDPPEGVIALIQSRKANGATIVAVRDALQSRLLGLDISATVSPEGRLSISTGALRGLASATMRGAGSQATVWSGACVWNDRYPKRAIRACTQFLDAMETP